LHGCTPQRTGRKKPAESAADDHNLMHNAMISSSTT
jgi:hypothetical protein